MRARQKSNTSTLKVVDIFSKQSLSKLDNNLTASPSELEKLGEYCGVFPRPAARKIHQLTSVLAAKLTIMDNLRKEYECIYELYREHFAENLALLNLELEEGKEFFSSEEGDIWMVKSEDLPKFTELMNTPKR